jgi:transposase
VESSRYGWRIPGCPGRSPRTHPIRARVVELARSGRHLRGLSKEFGVTDTTIRSWLRQADLDEGRRSDGLTSDEKKELAQLRKENKRLREEKEILRKATAWFAQEATSRRKKDFDS